MGRRTNTAKWVPSAARWQINAQKDGIRKTFVSSKPGRTGQREANAKADAWLDGGLQDRTTKAEQAYAQMIQQLEKTTSTGNINPIKSRYKIWIAPRIGSRRVEGLTVQQLQNIINDAYAAGKSRKTLQSIKSDLTRFVRFCRKAGLTTLSLDGDLSIPAGARRKQKTILQPKDIMMLMNINTTMAYGKRTQEPLIHLYRLAVLTGMRPGELLGLQWQDVHGCEIHLARSVNIYGETTQGKNDNAVRVVPLSDLAMRELEAQRQATGHLPAVFPQIREPVLLNHWHRYTAAAGITRCTLYELRHTFVSIAQQLPEGQVKAIVGHSQSMDTWGVYAHRYDGQSEQAARALDDVFEELL